MGRVNTNDVSITFAIEDTENDVDNIGFIAGETGPSGAISGSPTWLTVEPNSISTFGATFTRVSRSPISKRRARRKGCTTDLDSALDIDADVTAWHMKKFLEGFCFCTAYNRDLDFDVSGVATAADTYTIPAIDATQAGKLLYLGTGTGPTSLMWAKGFTNSDNNGLKTLGAQPVDTDTTLTVQENLVDETPAATASAELTIAGVRPEAGDIVIAVSSGVATVTSNNGTPADALDFTDLGLQVGQRVHIGGLTSTNRPNSYGSGRITSIAANTLLLDKIDSTLVASDGTDTGSGGTDVRTDILYGPFIKNVAVDDSAYLQRSYQFEAAFPALGSGGGNEYQYSKGNFCNEITFQLPLADKATTTLGFIGTDTTDPTPTRKTNAASAKEPNETSPYCTSSDVLRMRITQIDETGLTTDFKNFNLTLRNNITPDKVLGTLGATRMNVGLFEVDVETQLVFTNGDVIDAIRDNTTLTADFILRNDEGAIAFDLPNFSLGGGDREFPANEAVLINNTGEAFDDTSATISASIGISEFPVYPTS